MRQWIEHVRANQPDSDHLEVAELGTPDELITTLVDTARHEALRREAMAAHVSQTSPYEVMPPELQRRFLTVDHLRRVRPPWDGEDIERDVFPA